MAAKKKITAKKFTAEMLTTPPGFIEGIAAGIKNTNDRLTAIHLPTGSLDACIEAGTIAGVENVLDLSLWEIVEQSELIAKREKWKAKLLADELRRQVAPSNEQTKAEPAIVSVTWHKADATPPVEYPAGPLVGTKTQLAKWIMQKTDHRLLETPLQSGTYWGREDTRRQSSIWFKAQPRFAEATARRLADLV